MKKFLPYLIASGILILIFIIAFFGIDFVMRIAVGHKNEVEVPNLENMQFDVARKQCKKMKLFVRLEQKVYSDSIPRGYIISQKPKHGLKTKKNRTIEVIASLGQTMVRIPYLDNLTVLQAKLKLQNAGLQMGEKISRFSDEVKKGHIIFSRPMADEMISKNGNVNVVVSMGKFESPENENRWIDLLEK